MRGEYGIENVMQTLQDAKPHVASLATKQVCIPVKSVLKMGW